MPAVVIIIGILYPFALGAYYAFLNYAAINPSPHFVGLENFQRSSTSRASGERAVHPASSRCSPRPSRLRSGSDLRCCSTAPVSSARLFERVLILPLMIAPVIAGVIWKLMYNPQFGILNHLLDLGSTFDLLSRERALYSVILVDMWIYTPFVAILVLAGIRSLPKEPFEASEVDGASWFYMFRRLMLPMMWPYILVAVIFRFMDCLKIFDIIQVLTAGGPGVGHALSPDRRVRGLDHQPQLFARAAHTCSCSGSSCMSPRTTW